MRILGASTPLMGALVHAFLLASSFPVYAQTFYEFAGGLNYAGPSSSSNSQGAHYTRGYAVQGSIGRQFSERLGVRLDAVVNHFAVQHAPTFVGVACPRAGPCSQPPGTEGFAQPVGVAALTASGLLNVDPPGPGLRMYVVAGGGAYYLYQHPSAAGAVRPGISVGGGFALQLRPRSQVFVEARFHNVFGVSSQPTWFVPVTLGVRF